MRRSKSGARSTIARAVSAVLFGLLVPMLALAVPAAASAATYTVNTLADSPASAVECQGGPGDCSLRQALDRAVSGDTVNVPANPSAYLVTSGAIPVLGGITVQGAGAASTTISGGGADQVFNMLGGPVLTISNLTITQAHNGTGKEGGGAITGRSKALIDNLTLEGVTISNSDSTLGYGGAVEIAGNLVIRHSRFEGDSTTGLATGGGGALDVFSGEGSLTISDSVFTGDSTNAAHHGGGAILVENGATLSLAASTFSGDIAAEGGSGGAIQLDKATSATIYDSTFAGNAAGSGGAIDTEGSTLTLVNDTLAGNAAELGANLTTATATTTAENTIFAAASGGGEDCSGKVTTAGHNLEDVSPSTCGLSEGSGDLIGFKPGLGPLADNSSQDPTAGGPAQTLALAASSPAVGAGAAAGCTTVGSADERGFPRPGIVGSGCDIGAYELLAAIPTATQLTASNATVTAGAPVTLSASVVSMRSLPGAVPAAGGTVEFRDGLASLGSVALDASGHATLTSSTLAVGIHGITAVYSGDALHAASGTAPIIESVLAVPVPAPLISGVGQAHRTWREGGRLAALARTRRPPVGTSFSFALNTASTVVFAFTHEVAGRRVGARCVAPTRRNRHRRGCRRTVTAATLTFAGVAAGAHRLAFQGRLSRSRRLAPGSYTLLITATNATGRAGGRISFTIVKG